MTRIGSTSRRRSVLGLAATAVASAATALTLTAAGATADVAAKAVPAPPTAPTSASQIQNIDQVKTAIKGYYGDTVTSTLDPVTNTTPLHTFNPDGAYAQEMAGIASRAQGYLAHPKGHAQAQPGVTGTKAVLFDVDDTLLNTYNYEIYSNFVYNPTTNAAFVNSASFPAVPHMVDLEHAAESRGYTVFFLTGRPETQRAGTIANLTDQGYDVTSANLYLKDYTVDTWLSPCAPACSTTQYKSLTRQHIQSLGYEIYANFGDQYSDLNGGFADKTFKLPNPMYYLP